MAKKETPKKLFTDEDVKRLQRETAAENDGKTPKGSLAAKAQSAADKRKAQENK